MRSLNVPHSTYPTVRSVSDPFSEWFVQWVMRSQYVPHSTFSEWSVQWVMRSLNVHHSTFSEGFTLNLHRSLAHCRNERIIQSRIFSNCGFYTLTLLVTCRVLLYASCCCGNIHAIQHCYILKLWSKHVVIHSQVVIHSHVVIHFEAKSGSKDQFWWSNLVFIANLVIQFG